MSPAVIKAIAERLNQEKATSLIPFKRKDGTAVFQGCAKLEARRDAIDDQVGCLRPVPRLDPVVLEDRLNEWRRLLHASITQGRAVIQWIVRDRMRYSRVIIRHLHLVVALAVACLGLAGCEAYRDWRYPCSPF